MDVLDIFIVTLFLLSVVYWIVLWIIFGIFWSLAGLLIVIALQQFILSSWILINGFYGIYLYYLIRKWWNNEKISDAQHTITKLQQQLTQAQSQLTRARSEEIYIQGQLQQRRQ